MSVKVFLKIIVVEKDKEFHAQYFCTVTMQTKLTLEKERNSQFWVSQSFCSFSSLQQK